jgi:hypothetical protein
VTGPEGTGSRFPPTPIRDVRIRHQKINCAPHFAEITVDFEPAGPDAAGDFTFELAEDLTVDYEPADALPRFFAAASAGIEEYLRDPEHGITPSVHVTLRAARADTFGSHEPAFKIAGWLAAREASRRAAAGGSRRR